MHLYTRNIKDETQWNIPEGFELIIYPEGFEYIRYINVLIYPEGFDQIIYLIYSNPSKYIISSNPSGIFQVQTVLGILLIFLIY